VGEHVNQWQDPPGCLAVRMDRAFSRPSHYDLHSRGIAPDWYGPDLRPAIVPWSLFLGRCSRLYESDFQHSIASWPTFPGPCPRPVWAGPPALWKWPKSSIPTYRYKRKHRRREPYQPGATPQETGPTAKGTRAEGPPYRPKMCKLQGWVGEPAFSLMRVKIPAERLNHTKDLGHFPDLRHVVT
jgi:hypothetical protein